MSGGPLGPWAVRAARATLESALPGRPVPIPVGDPAEASERRGVFVTLKRFPSHELRGCIGFPEPVLPLGRAVREAALAAAREDPRFPPVEPSELARLVVETSILTRPERVASSEPAGRLAAVEVGRDGLIVGAGWGSGLLLPQVAVEQGWTAEEFLSGTCEKAGLDPNAWRRSGTVVKTFRAEVYAEAEPSGPAVEVRFRAARRAPGS